MDSPHSQDGDPPTPSLLKLFYRTGTFHRPDEFASPSSLPPHLQLHILTTTTTLLELAHHLASAAPSALPHPQVGTRLSFRLIYPDTASAYPPSSSSSTSRPDQAAPQPRYLAKDLGSLVLGEGTNAVAHGTDDDDDADATVTNARPTVSAAGKTLADAKFVVGDYLSVAVLPPDERTGAVAPPTVPVASSAYPRGVATGGGAVGGVVPPPPPRYRGEDGFASASGRGGRGRYGGGEWDSRAGRDRDRGGGGGFPEGEWRRGEAVPEGHGRGRRRGTRW